MWRVARRPRWIAALVLALAIAAAFALLGQWQLERSVEQPAVERAQTERAVPLEEATGPSRPVSDALAGQVVTVRGTLLAADTITLTGRGGGGSGESAWLVGHVVTERGESVAVALGWAQTVSGAAAAAPEDDVRVEIEGRYLPGEGPQESDFEAGERSRLAPAELINLWPDVRSMYSGYVVSHDSWEGLGRISSPAPEAEVQLNWLNVFYGLEWGLFAILAIAVWHRLVKDAYELEREELAEEQDRAGQEQAAAASADRDRP